MMYIIHILYRIATKNRNSLVPFLELNLMISKKVTNSTIDGIFYDGIKSYKAKNQKAKIKSRRAIIKCSLGGGSIWDWGFLSLSLGTFVHGVHNFMLNTG